jgi:hypothetical protein
MQNLLSAAYEATYSYSEGYTVASGAGAPLDALMKIYNCSNRVTTCTDPTPLSHSGILMRSLFLSRSSFAYLTSLHGS